MPQDESVAVAGSIEDSHLLPILRPRTKRALSRLFLNLPIELFPTDDRSMYSTPRKSRFIEVGGDVFAVLEQLPERGAGDLEAGRNSEMLDFWNFKFRET